MAALTPVDHDPFEAPAANLTPVDHDPFAQGAPSASAPPVSLAPATGEAELHARLPDIAERLSDLTGWSPTYWHGILHHFSAPARFLGGSEAPYQGLEQGLLHGGAYVASAGGNAPNAVSGVLGSAAHAMDATLAADENERRNERIKAGLDPEGTDYARLAGELTSPLSLETGKAGQAIVKNVIEQTPSWTKRGGDLATKVTGGIGTGAAIAAEQPVYGDDYAGTKAKQMALGAAIGGGAELAAPVIAPAASKSVELLKSIGTKLSAGQQAGGVYDKVGQMLGAMPLSGMASPRAPGIPSFNWGIEDQAVKQGYAPEFKGLIPTERPRTWEELDAMKARAGLGKTPLPEKAADASAIPSDTASSDLQVTGSGLGPFGRPRDPATHTLNIRLGNGAVLPIEGTLAEVEAAKHQTKQIYGDGATALDITPKSHWIGASMPARRAPPLPPAGTEPQGAGGLPGTAGSTGVGPAADLPPNSTFRGNLNGDHLPEPGYTFRNNESVYKGSLSSEPPDYVAARGGELPEDAAESAEATLPRTGEIVPGKDGRIAVKAIAQTEFYLALYGAPGETAPYLMADMPELQDKLLNARMRGVTDDTRKEYQDFLNGRVLSRFEELKTGAPDSTTTQAKISGPSLSNALKELDAEAAAARKSPGDGRVYSDALMNAKAELMDRLKAQDPITAARLKAADKMWGHYAVLRRGGVSAKDDLYGQMTPEQLSSASAAADRSPYKVDTSEGKTRYGDIARAGIDVNLRKPPEPSPEAKIGLASILPAAAVGAHSPWPLVAYPAMWAYSHLGGEPLARAYLNHAAPMLNTGLTKSAPVAANVAGVALSHGSAAPDHANNGPSPFAQAFSAQQPNYLARPSPTVANPFSAAPVSAPAPSAPALAPAPAPASAAQPPYDNTPRSEREWRALRLRYRPQGW